MADDKKKIPDAEQVDEAPESGKTELVKTDSLVQDQHTLTKAEASTDKDASLRRGAPFLWSDGKTDCGIYVVNF